MNKQFIDHVWKNTPKEEAVEYCQNECEDEQRKVCSMTDFYPLHCEVFRKKVEKKLNVNPKNI